MQESEQDGILAGSSNENISDESAEAENKNDSGIDLTQTARKDGGPKRPMNSFLIFCRKRRAEIVQFNKSRGMKVQMGDISKKLHEEWKNMPASQKDKYKEFAAIVRKEFDERNPNYVYSRSPNNTRNKKKKNANVINPHIPGRSPAAQSGPEKAPPHYPREQSLQGQQQSPQLPLLMQQPMISIPCFTLIDVEYYHSQDNIYDPPFSFPNFLGPNFEHTYNFY
ncbi:high mobility group box domain-containing protein [Cyathus striatus]|nr:high mobility group box domain-containing protein [Cyathus striatus]